MQEEYVGGGDWFQDLGVSSDNLGYLAQIAEGMPAKGQVPLADKGNFHVFGTMGTGADKRGLKEPGSDVCRMRWMEVSVYAEQDFTGPQ